MTKMEIAPLKVIAPEKKMFGKLMQINVMHSIVLANHFKMPMELRLVISTAHWILVFVHKIPWVVLHIV